MLLDSHKHQKEKKAATPFLFFLQVLNPHGEHRCVQVEERSHKLPICAPHIISFVSCILPASIRIRKLVGPLQEHNAVPIGWPNEVQDVVPHCNRNHGQKDLTRLRITACVAKTELEHAAPVPLEALFVGEAPGVEGHLVPCCLNTGRRIHLVAEECAAAAQHQGTMRRGEANGWSCPADHRSDRVSLLN